MFATNSVPIDTMREYLRDRGGAVDEVAFAQAYEYHQAESRRRDADTATAAEGGGSTDILIYAHAQPRRHDVGTAAHAPILIHRERARQRPSNSYLCWEPP